MSSFQSKIFQEIEKSYAGKNFIISPLSIYYILSLTANGAKNNTLSEILSILSHQSKEEINNFNKSILSLVNGFQSVNFANGLFTKVPIKDTFVQTGNEYKAKVDLLKDANQINQWCREATHEKIPQIINSIGPNDLMVLINGIYFKGDWRSPFNEENTKKDNFLNFGKQPNQVDFMKSSGIVVYFENNEVQAVTLNYMQDFMEALIILPKNESDINNYIKNFSSEKYQEIIGHQTQKKVDLSLPKFKVDFEAEMKDYLSALGMNQAFTEKADFTDMLNGNEKAFIGRVLHKTFLNVNEEGTEAGAATAMVMCNSWVPPEPAKVMNVNHPFLFIVRNGNLPSGHDMLFISKIEYL